MKQLQFKVLSLLLLPLAISCSKEMVEKAAPNNGTDMAPNATLKAATTLGAWEIAKHYAPVIIQDVDITDGGIFGCNGSSKTGSADWIAPVNYDGDWDASNNWDNMVSEGRDKGKLKACAYFNFAKTATHWYILYSVYHPRDWTDNPVACSLDSHENDMEGVLVCASRGSDGNSLGNVQYISTIWHTGKKNYKRRELQFEGARPKIFIQSKGHGIRKYEGDKDKDGTYIVYKHGSNVTQPQKDGDDLPQTCKYYLLSLKKQLWNRKDNNSLFVGNAFNGNTYRDNAANAPWAWGDICNKPAHHIKSVFGLSNHNTSYEFRDIQ